MKKILLTILILGACTCYVAAQRPKLDLKAYGGYHTHVFVYKEYEKSKDVFHGWQGGFGFRVTHRKLMGEINFNFIRSKAVVLLPDSLQTDEFDKFTFRFNSFELPLKVGLKFINEPAFKWYGFTGLSFRFNTKGKLELGEESVIFKPKEVGLSNPNIDWLIGTQFDVYGFNIEVMYNLGVSNSIRENIRTNSHELILNFGILF